MIPIPDREVRKTMLRLRAHAIELGFMAAAEAYGQSAIRLGMAALSVELSSQWPAIDP